MWHQILQFEGMRAVTGTCRRLGPGVLTLNSSHIETSQGLPQTSTYMILLLWRRNFSAQVTGEARDLVAVRGWCGPGSLVHSKSPETDVRTHSY